MWAMLETVTLLTLPAIVFPAIYLAYLRTRKYRQTEIDALVMIVMNVRQEKVDPELTGQLSSDLDFLYNWKNYAVPILMSCLGTLIATFAALSRAGLSLGVKEIQGALFGRVSAVVLAGIAGAYVANLVDLTEHALVRNLSSSYFQTTWVRLISGALLGYIAGRVFEGNIAILAAFGVGAAPVKEGLGWVMEKAREAWGMHAKEPLPSEQPTLQHLQGMTEEIITTLDEQGIKSTQQLAYASPAKLLARTNIEWVVILDAIDQALLFNYFGENFDKFRIFGIRGSIEMGTLYEELHSTDAERRSEAEATLGRLAKILPEMDESSLKHAIHTLYEDLTVRQLARMFGGTLAREQAPPMPKAA